MVAAEKQSLRKRYKFEGMLGAFILMWLDFPLLYQGVVSHNSPTLGAGFLIMLVAGGIAYYFS